MELSLIEIGMLRDNFENDERAINRHSVRYYVLHVNGEDIGLAIYIDRQLSLSPVEFEVSELGHFASKGISKSKKDLEAKVITSKHIGKCTTWSQIESALPHILQDLSEPVLTPGAIINLKREIRSVSYIRLAVLMQRYTGVLS
jgi:hypothetical protein